MLRKKKIARCAAILWTLLIFLLCFLPSKEIPDVHIPMIDKWAHFVLFAVFSLLWLASLPRKGTKYLLVVFVVAVILGWVVELVQGQLGFLGRSYDRMDIVADGIGGLIGVLLFVLTARIRRTATA